MLVVEKTQQPEALLKVLAKNGVYPILETLRRNPQRFSQLMFAARLNPGILDRHLKSLMHIEAIEKNGDVYVLTNRGHRLISVLHNLLDLYSE